MKILLLGATGRTGRIIIDLAIQRDYKINCLVRNSEKIKKDHNTLKIFEGSPERISDLEVVMQGCNAIISVLSISRKSDFPWAKLRTPKTFLSDVMNNVIQLAEKHNIKRVIMCSAWGVSDSKKDIPKWFKWLIDNSNIGVTYKDHGQQEELLKKSNLSWTIVRPSGLTNSKKEQGIIESYRNKPKPKMTISRLSVAKYMVNALNNDELIGKTPVISRQ